MTRVAHILDDTTLGGVTRLLDLIAQAPAGGIAHATLVVGPDVESVDVAGADVAVVHLSAAWSRLPLLARLRATPGLRLALVEHTYTAAFERMEVRHRARFRLLLRLAYGLAHRVIAVSQAQAAWMAEARLVPRGRITVIRPASDCAHLLALAPPQRMAGPLRLGAMGRLCAAKGFDVLVEAMRRLPAGTAVLTIAGDGPDRSALARSAAAVGDGRVCLVGAIADHARWLGGIDAVVVPSRRESFGIVALEARMAARPLVAAAVDGLSEQLAAGGGLLVAPNDPDALAAAIARLARADVATLGRAARAGAAAHPAATIMGWRSLVQELAWGTPARALVAQSQGTAPH